MARAQSVLGAFAEAAAAIARGVAAAQALDDAQDKAYVLGELGGIPLEA